MKCILCIGGCQFQNIQALSGRPAPVFQLCKAGKPDFTLARAPWITGTGTLTTMAAAFRCGSHLANILVRGTIKSHKKCWSINWKETINLKETVPTKYPSTATYRRRINPSPPSPQMAKPQHSTVAWPRPGKSHGISYSTVGSQRERETETEREMNLGINLQKYMYMYIVYANPPPPLHLTNQQIRISSSISSRPALW